MILPYILLIPTIGTLLWVFYAKWQQRKIIDMVLFSFTLLALGINYVLVCQLIQSGLNVWQHLLQMVASAVVLPLAYMYFAHQVGRQTANNTATVLLWVLVGFTFVPEILFYDPNYPLSIPREELTPYNVYYISDGKISFSIHTGDLVTIIQCLVTIIRIIPFVFMLRKLNLHLNSKVYAFLGCWAAIIIFVFMVGSMDYEELCSPLGSAFYYIFYNLLLIFANILIAKGYDLYPIENDQQESIEDLSIYVQQQYSDIAMRLRTLMKDQELFTNSQLTAEQVIEDLNTNHTYFSQMMSSEFGMSFSEYINSMRLNRVEKLLRDESLTISAVAQQSGFADAGYMSRKFKAKHGITPSEWRKSNAN